MSLSPETDTIHTVLFVSRNKDNAQITNHKERREVFITKEPMDSSKLMDRFLLFTNSGNIGETSRFYYSVNERNAEKINQDLQHFLIDNPNYDPCRLPSKLASIAMKPKNAKTKQWMFDFDSNDSEKVFEFMADIRRNNPTCIISPYTTPNGYAIVVNHGFDTQQLLQKWTDIVTLKRDGMICYHWATPVKGDTI